MKENLLIIGIVVLSLVLIGSIVAQDAEVTEVSPFSLTSWFQHTFNIQSFSVVGDTQGCGGSTGLADYTFVTSGGEEFQGSASDYCGNEHGIWDVFSPGWNPFKEYKDFVHVICNPNSDQCNFELYCCPNPTPLSDSDCENWVGDFSEMETVSCTDWDSSCNDGKSGYKCPGESCSGIPYESSSYNYCTDDVGVTCWYYDGSGSSCTEREYSGRVDCPYAYQSQLLYEDKDDCEDEIPQQCSDTSWTPNPSTIDCDDSFTQTSNCGNTRTSTGTKDCGGNGGTCGDGTCDSGESCSSCVSDCGECTSEDPEVNVVISDISIPSKVKPGEPVEVNFIVKNNGETRDYLIETGIIPKETADAWQFSYSIFDWFNVQYNTECCDGQQNIFAKTTELKSGEIDEFKIKIPRAPYEDISDSCYDNVYWNGTGEYVLYVVVKNKCFKDGGLENVYATKTILIDDKEFEGDCTVPYKNLDTESSKDFGCNLFGVGFLDIGDCFDWFSSMATSISRCSETYTRQEFRKISDMSIIDSFCDDARNCNPYSAENYTVSCVDADYVGISLPRDIVTKVVSIGSGREPGLCLAEPEGGYPLKAFEWAAWFDINGDGKKDGTDGLIIVLIGGTLLLIIIIKK